MVTVAGAPAVAPELWERVRDRFAGQGRRFAKVRAVVGWACLAVLVVVLVAEPAYRAGAKTYLFCLWILIIWFAVARTRTITWAGLARMFTVGLVWSWVVAGISLALAARTGLQVRDAGPGAAIAALTEESLKLAPLAVLAVVAPGRVRRFAAVDWLLLGLASGLGFQAWEEMVRRTYRALNPPGLLELLLTVDDANGAPQYGWGLLSGGSGFSVGGDVAGFAGHHVLTAMTAGCVGLAVAFWRRSGRWRWAALAFPVAAFLLSVTDHFGYNAVAGDPFWTSAEQTSAPWVFRLLWPLLGKGTGHGWLLLLVLLACLMVDARRLAMAGERTDLPVEGWLGAPRRLAELWIEPVRPRLTGSSALLMVPVSAACYLVAFGGRDLVFLAQAHSRVNPDQEQEGRPGSADPVAGGGSGVLDAAGESRRAALIRGRWAAALLRQVRAEAIASQVPGRELGQGSEVAARRRVRGVAACVLVALAVCGLVLAPLVAHGIGADLTPGSAWLAGLFDNLAQWWSGLGPGQKLLTIAGAGALVALSGGSFGLALGAAGVFTYTAEHGRGAADFSRDPVRATRSWLATTTPGEAALDTAEFGLTFLPAGAFGAVTGRGVRQVAREYADDPARFWAARRQAPAEGRDRGSVDLSVFYGQKGPTITDKGVQHSLKHVDTWFGNKDVTPERVAQWRTLVDRATRSREVVPWRSGQTDTFLHLYRVGDGRYFAVQFDRTSYELVTAFRPNPGQVGAILRLLKGQ